MTMFIMVCLVLIASIILFSMLYYNAICVSASDWNISLEPIDLHAKEILLKCTK